MYDHYDGDRVRSAKEDINSLPNIVCTATPDSDPFPITMNGLLRGRIVSNVIAVFFVETYTGLQEDATVTANQILLYIAS